MSQSTNLAGVMEAKQLTFETAAHIPYLQAVEYTVDYANIKLPAIQYTYGKYPTYAQAEKALAFVNSFPDYRGTVTESHRN